MWHFIRYKTWTFKSSSTSDDCWWDVSSFTLSAAFSTFALAAALSTLSLLAAFAFTASQGFEVQVKDFLFIRLVRVVGDVRPHTSCKNDGKRKQDFQTFHFSVFENLASVIIRFRHKPNDSTPLEGFCQTFLSHKNIYKLHI